MKPIDYGRSFIIGKSPANEVRFWIESRTHVIDREAGTTTEYIQAASCKSENTFAPEDLFRKDNYDFLPVFSPDYAAVFRRHGYLNSDYREICPADAYWDGQKKDLVEADSTELAGSEEFLAATYENLPLVAQTEIWNEQSGLRAIIEYPVKTMNTIRQSLSYQVDTGPVAFPDLSRRYDPQVECISLAFVAFNATHFADFVIEVPTPVCADGTKGDELAKIYHYSQIESFEAKNRMYRIH